MRRARPTVSGVTAPEVIRSADIQVPAALGKKVDAASRHVAWQVPVREQRHAQQALQLRLELVHEGCEFSIQDFSPNTLGALVRAAVA